MTSPAWPGRGGSEACACSSPPTSRRSPGRDRPVAPGAIAWVRMHAAEYGGNPEALFIAGSSAGAYLAIRAVGESTDPIAGLIGRYGYYGDLTLRDGPPLLVIHGRTTS
ncbi:carboxylesterase family protein [Catellatospora sp. KI3]|nr:carboxylesterase family protein [Catellatospora sp. KI3]MDI1463467.1 carboxylesterase family protein [Catellatospora sp. KI3]